MCPVTPGTFLAMFAYSGTAIVTLIMAITRYERWWIGLIVMAALVILAIFESFCLVIYLIASNVIGYLRARKIQDKEEREHEMACYKSDIDMFMLVLPPIMGMIVAVFGLVAIPVYVCEYLSQKDILKAFRRKRSL